MTHFVPTIIGLPRNAGIAVRTTVISPERLERELQLGSTERTFQQGCASLAESASLLSSVIAFDWLACWLELSAKTTACQVKTGLAHSSYAAVKGDGDIGERVGEHGKRHVGRIGQRALRRVFRMQNVISGWQVDLEFAFRVGSKSDHFLAVEGEDG